MPYNPGASYQGGQYIAQGRSNFVQAIMSLVGGLTHDASQAKELRTTLKTAYGADAADFNSMGLDELRGYANAKDIATKQSAAKLVADEVRQRIAGQQATLDAQKDVGPFAQAMQSALQGAPAVTSGGAPAQGPAAPPASPLSALFSAAAQYPGGAQQMGLTQGSALAQLLRANNTTGTIADRTGLTPVSVGSGERKVSGAFTTMGKFVPDAEYEARLAKARVGSGAGSRAATPVLPKGGRMVKAKDADGDVIPGLFHIQDSKGNYVGSWHDSSAQRGGVGDFLKTMGVGAAGGVSGANTFKSVDDIKAAYRSGKLTYDEAAGHLQQQFGIGVPTAAPAVDEEETAPAPDESE